MTSQGDATTPTAGDTAPEAIAHLAQTISLLVYEGKTVTAANKKSIKEAAEEIIALSKQIKSPPPSQRTTTPISEESFTKWGRNLVAEIHSAIGQSLKSITATANLPTHPPANDKSYAAILKTNLQPKNPALIIEPKTSSPTASSSPSANAENTLNIIKTQISFKDRNYAPTKLKALSKGRVYMEFSTDSQKEETKSRIHNLSTLKAEEPKRRSPLVILKGIHKDTKREEICELICKQNSIPNTDVRLCFLTTNHSDKLYNAVLEIKPASYQRLLHTERVAISYQQVHIEPFSHYLQCRNCLQFGHSHNKCIATIHPCRICAATTHTGDNCPQKGTGTFTCYNCTRHNTKFGTKLSTDHAANNQTACTRIHIAKQKAEETTDFGHV